MRILFFCQVTTIQLIQALIQAIRVAVMEQDFGQVNQTIFICHFQNFEKLLLMTRSLWINIDIHLIVISLKDLSLALHAEVYTLLSVDTESRV